MAAISARISQRCRRRPVHPDRASAAESRSPGGLVFFDTPIYAVFLTLVVIAYWRMAWRQQNVFLLVASYVFYGWWDVRFLALIALSTVVDFHCARAIHRSDAAAKRRALLTLSLVINLGFLAVFKYFNFF